jgi:ABC-type transporter Mla subunit MlaD
LQHIPKETVVGIIVVAVLCAIVGGVFAYRKSNAFQIKITFEEGHGLQVGDTVFIRGANAGQVVSAAFKNGQFVVTIDVQTQMASQVRRGSEFFILTEKIAMNKKCISIVVTDPNSPPIKSGEVVKGDDSLFRYYLGHELPKAAGQAIKEVDTLLKKGVDAIKDRVGGGDE